MSETDKHTHHECSETFLQAAMEHLGLDEEMQFLLRTPYRVVRIELPLRRSDGNLSVFTGVRVQHNNSRGPFKGGLRYHPELDVAHARGLAALMTWKTSLAGIPMGGGKGGIDCDPRDLTETELEQLTKQFTQRMGDIIGPQDDIPAPDVGTGPREMAWIYDAYARLHGDQPAVVTGKPLELGGSPGRAQATGRGVATVTRWATETQDVELNGASVAIQGFGNVGANAAQFLAELGARVVAVSDVDGGLRNGDGLDIETLRKRFAAGKIRSVAEAGDLGETIDNESLLKLDVDILIPAALGGAIHADNMADVKAGMIVEAANLPVTCEADQYLTEKGVTIIPDILANAGGVIVSYLEWVQNREGYHWSEENVNQELEKRMRTSWESVRQCAEDEQTDYRKAAYLLAVDRVKRATTLRGFL